MSAPGGEYPGIAAACQLIALDNGGINRSRSVAKQGSEMRKWLAKQPAEMVEPIDAWLSSLSEADLDEVCCGCADDEAHVALLMAAPPFTDELLNSYFDEVC
ncbi:hypothetical protein [Aureimonas sp. N4]|uniref:hypothetical protein n=1 Tax=Aureimonas sp. N4 TaxID=1638165 RepID=UPI00078398B7|nr:hypothetical protein [Aureimonas sp. N4]